MDGICEQIDKLFENKELTKLLTNARKSIHIGEQVDKIDNYLEHIGSLLQGSSGEMFFHINIGVDFTKPAAPAYWINTSTKDIDSKLFDTIELTDKEKEEIKEFCSGLFIRHFNNLAEKRKELIKKLEEDDNE